MGCQHDNWRWPIYLGPALIIRLDAITIVAVTVFNGRRSNVWARLRMTRY